MPPFQQGHRQVGFGSPLGEDVLLLKSFEGRSELGRPFEYYLELFSEDHDINFDDIVGQNVTVRLERPDGETRYFNGYISKFAQAPEPGNLAKYHATLVPWLWFLTRTSDCRIFQNMTVPDIVKQVVNDHGFTDLDDALSGSYREWEYCVQYRETDFDFVSRLLEQEGIYYFFEHENGKHKLVLADGDTSHEKIAGYEEVPYFPPNKQVREEECIREWRIEREVQTAKYELTEYDYIQPKKALVARSSVTRDHAGAEFAQFDYAAEYKDIGDGEHYAKVRLEELQSRFETLTGKGDVRGLTTGCLFKLTHPARADQEREYLITSASYKIRGDLMTSDKASGRIKSLKRTKKAKDAAEDDDGEDGLFSIEFTALPSDQQYRSRRTTPRPQIRGPQTAFVVGKAGEEIWTDEHGRVKVQFHWDRYSNADESSSCWVRVAQNWAGKKWGSMFLPRIGQEVIVEFLEGDPDRPIITGRVYNGVNKPPYDLPANKTRSTYKTNSSKGGQGFNEIRFDDKKDEEQIFIHAEKNRDTRVKNDAFQWIGNQFHLIVVKDQIEKVEADKHSTVVGNRISLTEGDRNDTTKGDRLVAIEGGDHLTVTGDLNTKADGDINLEGAANINQKAGSKLSIEVGEDYHEKAGQNYAMEAGQAIHFKAGDTIVIEAASQISLKVGGSFVDIGPAGVSIKGPAVNINSGGSAGSGGGSSPTAPTAPEEPEEPLEPTEAADEKPGETAEPPKAPKPPKPVTYSAAAEVMKQAAEDGTPFCEKCEEAKKKQAAGGAS